MSEPWWQLALARGHCTRAAAAESGCAKCVRAYAAIDRLAAVVATTTAYHDAFANFDVDGVKRQFRAIQDALDALNEEPGDG